MAENSNNNNGLYFVVGGLVVAVGLGVFAYSSGYIGGKSSSRTSVEQTTTTAPSPLGTTTTTTTTEKSR